MEEEKKVYLGNLEYGVTEGDIVSLLETAGVTATEIKLISDKLTGRPKGFGFAEFATAEDAQKAIEALDGQELNGRKLNVNKAKKMQPRSRDNFGGGGGGSRGGYGNGGGRGGSRY
ncbi:MAG: RNA-binding protein [Candidatus Omnitrophica bacterium]|nr:RNA-binding protein [Candidatus Omnitrophota bacterium]